MNKHAKPATYRLQVPCTQLELGLSEETLLTVSQAITIVRNKLARFLVTVSGYPTESRDEHCVAAIPI